jgi:signal peptidase I
MSSVRKLDALAAILMGIVGLGYLYVGRIRIAVILLLSALALICVLSWTRLVLKPLGVCILVAGAIFVVLLNVFHPPLIARTHKVADSRFYNRWYFYVGWFVGLRLCYEILFIAFRPQIFGYEIFQTPARSMSPTLMRGDWFTVDTWRYRDLGPQFGDVVAFKTTDGYTFVQRVVGLPRDQIEIRSGVLYRNGITISEPYVHRDSSDVPFGRDSESIALGADQFYVLGDYRDQSRDSRLFGPITKSQLVGRTEYIVFSWDRGIQTDRFPSRISDDT